MLAEGSRFGPYRLISLLGRGGMGEVWRALKIGPSGYGWSRQVALKVILPTFAREKRYRDMFISEARIAASLLHPNIVAVTDFGAEGDMLWLEQELVDGTHAGRMAESAPEGVPPPLALFVICEALKGLGHAHAHERPDGSGGCVIHRDIKPGNLLVGREGHVKVTDFGIAKIMSQAPSLTAVKGTIGYMAPELLDGTTPSERSDLFAMGLVLWELLTGRKLFDGDNDAVRMFKSYECIVPPLASWQIQVPPVMEAAMRRMLARDPADRFATANEALAALFETPGGREARSLELKDYLVRLGLRVPSSSLPPGHELWSGLGTRTGSIAGEVGSRLTRLWARRSIWAGAALLGVGVAMGMLLSRHPSPPAAPASPVAPAPARAVPPMMPPPPIVVVTPAPAPLPAAAPTDAGVPPAPDAAPPRPAPAGTPRPAVKKKTHKHVNDRDQILLEPE